MSNYETSNETASQRELNIHFIFVWNTIYPEMEASADKQVAGSNRPLASAQKSRIKIKIKMRETEHVAHG